MYIGSPCKLDERGLGGPLLEDRSVLQEEVEDRPRLSRGS